MEPEGLTHRPIQTDDFVPLQHPRKVKRPLGMIEILMKENYNGKSNATCWQRMFPLKIFFIWVFIQSGACGICFGLGSFFVNVILPDSEYTISANSSVTFLLGVLCAIFFYVLAILFTAVKILIGMHCVGGTFRHVPI